MLIIDEPIFEKLFLLLTKLKSEKFSMPHVSGIQIVSGLDLLRWLEHAKTSSIVSNEPRLYDNLIVINI